METMSLCPFCNGDARIAQKEHDRTMELWVECNACGAKGPSVEFFIYIKIDGQVQQKQSHAPFEQEVVKAWNKRHKD